jgi:hypothetical protein
MPVIICSSCRAENSTADVFCYNCSRKLEAQQSKESAVPFFCGLLLCIVGAVGLVTYAAMAAIGNAVIPSVPLAGQILQNCGLVGMVVSLMPILAGIFTGRRSFWAGIFGSIAGMCVIGPYLLCTILSIIVLVIVIMCKEEFLTSVGSG